MFKALDENNNPVWISNAKKDFKYHCPFCGASVFIKAENSSIVSKHFAHVRNVECDDFCNDMSEWHYSWQMMFPEMNREVVVEKDGVKHRADILINNTVIEFQHSPITTEEIYRRNMFYLSCGYDVVWVFDGNDLIKHEKNGSINPEQCYESDLCWKRARHHFSQKMPQRVVVIIDYKIKQDNDDSRTLLLLVNYNEKYFSFYKTYCRIKQENLLKQYGIGNDTFFSISELIKNTETLKKSQNRTDDNRYRYNIKSYK